MNGPTCTLALDGERLGKQLAAVKAATADGAWYTFAEIAARSGIRPTAAASISARLRELRARGYVVDRQRRGDPKDGLWEYRVTEPFELTSEVA